MSHIYKILVYFGSIALLSISCNNSSEGSGQGEAILEKQKIILSRLDKIAADLTSLKSQVSKIKNTPSKPNSKPKNNKKAADPNKVYNIEVGDSFVKGKKDAKVTIIEWMDFQ